MLNYEFPPLGGGTGSACYYMLKEFSRDPKLEISLVTYSPDNSTREETFAPNITIHYVACGRKKSLHHWRMSELARWLIHTRTYVLKHLSTRKYDVIHCWSGWPAGMIGYLARNHAPYIIALRGSDIPGYNKRTALLDALLLKRISRRIWQQASAVTIVSRNAADLASATASVPFKVIHNGVDTDRFCPRNSSQIASRIRLIYVGRLTPRKGIDDLLRALTLIARENPALAETCSLTIAGSGISEQELKDYVRINNLDALVTFAGIVPHDQLSALLRQHDIFVLPSHKEAFSNAMQEAVASGLAILTTPTGGAEVLDGNGMIFEAANPTGLKAKLTQYLENPNLLHAHKQASERMRENLGWDACCRRYVELYESSGNARAGYEI